MILDSNLRERSFGAWEGELYHDLRRLLESQNVPDFDKSPPNGESVQMVWDRVVSFLPVVWDAEGDVVIVSHGGTCGMILAQLLEAPIETARAFRFPNAAITELSVIDRPKCHLIRYADVNHLSRASAPQIDAQTKA
jgi:alpha-ribazole phosphatase/probable phosphoglycerate mutase